MSTDVHLVDPVLRVRDGGKEAISSGVEQFVAVLGFIFTSFFAQFCIVGGTLHNKLSRHEVIYIIARCRRGMLRLRRYLAVFDLIFLFLEEVLLPFSLDGRIDTLLVEAC